jgi:hypothetical protein
VAALRPNCVVSVSIVAMLLRGPCFRIACACLNA